MFFCKDLQFHQTNQTCTWYRNFLPSQFRKIQHIQNSFKTLQTTTNSIQFSTIPLVSIKKFKACQFKRGSLPSSRFSLEDTISQQICLEYDIREVNLNICKINSGNKVSTIRLDKDISKTSIKKEGQKWEKQKKNPKKYELSDK